MKKITLLLCCLVIFLFITAGYAENSNNEKSFGKFLSRARYGAKDCHFSLHYNRMVRKYNVHLPYGFQAKKKLPVVIYLHGGGGSIKGAYQEGLDKASDRHGFILVIPAGTGFFPEVLLTWNAGKWEGGVCCGYASDNNIDDVGFISRMIDDLKVKFDIDKERIFVTGISNGGIMSYRLACELADKIAAVAVVAPPAIPQGCIPKRPISIMHIIGTDDPCVPYQGGLGGGCLGKVRFKVQAAQDMVNAWSKMNACSDAHTTTYKKGNATCVTYTSCGQGTAVEFCTIEGMGHTWPSGRQYMPAEKVGVVSYDISFDQIWEFFEKHTLKEAAQ